MSKMSTFTIKPQCQLGRISDRAQRLIDSCRTDGNGLHYDMCRIANYLRHDVSEEDGIQILYDLAISRGYTARKAKYHAEQLRKKWHDAGEQRRPAIPTVKSDLDLIWKVVDGSDFTVTQLTDLSLIKLDSEDESVADNVVDLLLPGAVICVGLNRWDAYCDYHREFEDPLSMASFICPNPMKEPGIYDREKEWKPGHRSPRFDANVLCRRWLVVEFDISRYARDGKTKTFWYDLIDEWQMDNVSIQDVQARLIQRICGYDFPLGMVVFSGSKSLHSWFPVARAGESQIKSFIERAMLLGADQAIRIPCQYFRMPGGWNYEKKARQPVLYLNPTALTSNTKE